MKNVFFVAGASLLGLTFLERALGWHANVGFLSGTVPGSTLTLGTGLLYAFTWFATVFLSVPLLMVGLLPQTRKRRTSPRSTSP